MQPWGFHNFPHVANSLISPHIYEDNMKIELGHLPDPELNPNRTMHYIKKWRAQSIAKQEAYVLCLATGEVPPEPYSRVEIAITFVGKDKRKRDLDNLFASMKPYLDGIVQAKVIPDDSTEYVADYHLRYRVRKEANTIIEIRRY